MTPRVHFGSTLLAKPSPKRTLGETIGRAAVVQCPPADTLWLVTCSASQPDHGS